MSDTEVTYERGKGGLYSQEIQDFVAGCAEPQKYKRES